MSLSLFRGSPLSVLSSLHSSVGLSCVCFEQDCEPVWKTRDEAVKRWCEEKKVPWVEKIGHTLWNPHEVQFGYVLQIGIQADMRYFFILQFNVEFLE